MSSLSIHSRGRTGSREADLSASRLRARVLRLATRLHWPDPLAQAESAANRPIDAEHLTDLEAQMDLLRVAVELESRADYGDTPSGDQRNRTSFLAHFAELESALAEWDAAVERVQAASATVWGWFEHATSARGLTEPPFALGPLIDRLGTLTVERARHRRLDTPHRLYLQRFEGKSTGHVSVYVDGQNIAQLPAGSPATVQRRADAIGQCVQTLFDDAQTCGQAAELVSARDSLLSLKQPLLDGLALHASLEAVAFAASCPFCQRQLEPY